VTRAAPFDIPKNFSTMLLKAPLSPSFIGVTRVFIGGPVWHLWTFFFSLSLFPLKSQLNLFG